MKEEFMIKEKAINYFMNGFSCSESIVKASIDLGLCEENLLPCSTIFSAGMSSGCVCGTISGAQLVLGHLFGRNNKYGNQISAREKAAELVSEFKDKNKVTCCRVLCSGLEGSQKKEHCCKLVCDSSDILEKLVEQAGVSISG